MSSATVDAANAFRMDVPQPTRTREIDTVEIDTVRYASRRWEAVLRR